MNHRRIRSIFTALAGLGFVALAVLGFVAATSAPAHAVVCRGGACPWW